MEDCPRIRLNLWLSPVQIRNGYLINGYLCNMDSKLKLLMFGIYGDTEESVES